MWLAGFSCLFEILFFFVLCRWLLLLAFCRFGCLARWVSDKNNKRVNERRQNKINFWFLFIIIFCFFSALLFRAVSSLLTHEISFSSFVVVHVEDEKIYYENDYGPVDWFSRLRVLVSFFYLYFFFSALRPIYVCVFLSGECSMILTFRLKSSDLEYVSGFFLAAIFRPFS